MNILRAQGKDLLDMGIAPLTAVDVFQFIVLKSIKVTLFVKAYRPGFEGLNDYRAILFRAEQHSWPQEAAAGVPLTEHFKSLQDVSFENTVDPKETWKETDTAVLRWRSQFELDIMNAQFDGAKIIEDLHLQGICGLRLSSEEGLDYCQYHRLDTDLKRKTHQTNFLNGAKRKAA